MASDDGSRARPAHGRRLGALALTLLLLAFGGLMQHSSIVTRPTYGAAASVVDGVSRVALEPPPDVDLTNGTRTVLLRGCGPESKSTGEGIACHSERGIPELLELPPERRWDPALRNPCSPERAPPAGADGASAPAAAAASYCVPYFYVLGAFHSGARDLFARLSLHPLVRTPAILARDKTYPEYSSETFPWERMLWRGCDWGHCPHRRGMGGEPLTRAEVPELLQTDEPPTSDAPRGAVLGELAHGSLTFTWSATHSLLHEPWVKALEGCVPKVARGDLAAKQACFPAARAAQEAWERALVAKPAASDGSSASAAASPGPRRAPWALTVPWLMRGVHGLKVRFLSLLREPAARMHSAYYFWPQYRRRYGHAEDGFHAYAVEMVEAFDACLDAVGAQAAATGARAAPGAARAAPADGAGAPASLSSGYTDALVQRWRASGAAAAAAGRGGAAPTAAQRRAVLEACAFNFESLSRSNQEVYYHADQLLKSLYAAFVPSWLEAFGAERVLLMRAEDYWAEPRATLRRAFEFLGLPGPADEAAWRRLLAPPVSRLPGSENATYWADKAVTNYLVDAPAHRRRPAAQDAPSAGGGRTRIRAPMRADTARRLRAFFAPHNAALARLLDDPRFEWADVVTAPGEVAAAGAPAL